MNDNNNPNNPQNTPFDQPASPTAQPAFGFEQTAKPDEKYDTMYLISNLSKDRRRTQLTVAAIIVALALGVILWIAIRPEPPPPELKAGQHAIKDKEPAAAPQVPAVPASTPTPAPAAATAPPTPDKK